MVTHFFRVSSSILRGMQRREYWNHWSQSNFPTWIIHVPFCPVPDSISGLRIPDLGFPYASKNADSRKTFINAFHGQWTFRFTDSLVSGQLYLPALFSIPLFTSQSNSVFTHSHILSEKCRCLGGNQKKRRDKGMFLLPWRACFRSSYSFLLSLFLRYVLKLY